jgi:hypothetical protein
MESIIYVESIDRNGEESCAWSGVRLVWWSWAVELRERKTSVENIIIMVVTENNVEKRLRNEALR